MKNYLVSVPITGYITVSVEADSEEEAKQAGLDKAGECRTTDIEEWEVHERIVRGNVFYGSLNEIDVSEDE